MAQTAQLIFQEFRLCFCLCKVNREGQILFTLPDAAPWPIDDDAHCKVRAD